MRSKLWKAENQQKVFEQLLKILFLLQSSQQNIFNASEVAFQNISEQKNIFQAPLLIIYDRSLIYFLQTDISCVNL